RPPPGPPSLTTHGVPGVLGRRDSWGRGRTARRPGGPHPVTHSPGAVLNAQSRRPNAQSLPPARPSRPDVALTVVAAALSANTSPAPAPNTQSLPPARPSHRRMWALTVVAAAAS